MPPDCVVGVATQEVPNQVAYKQRPTDRLRLNILRLDTTAISDSPREIVKPFRKLFKHFTNR
jgi:hypothetical protein